MEELGSASVISSQPDEASETDAQAARQMPDMNPFSDSTSSFVYCDVCRDRTDEERQLAAVMEIAKAHVAQERRAVGRGTVRAAR
jgi:hypothetical protein